MWEPFASAMAVELAANMKNGRITAFSAEVFSDTHRGRPRAGPGRAGPGKLLSNRFRAEPIRPSPATPNMGAHAGMHRNLDPAYAIDENVWSRIWFPTCLIAFRPCAALVLR